jgi:segregation and condensation protein A
VRASSVLAALEIARDGHAQLRQREPYAPLYVRACNRIETADE